METLKMNLENVISEIERYSNELRDENIEFDAHSEDLLQWKTVVCNFYRFKTRIDNIALAYRVLKSMNEE